MPSTLAWLDHSEVQRRRMMEVIGLFREKGTVDDLGLGSIRDTFSELLFPGTSTLHTRAKYLLFVPWVFRTLEDDGVSSSRGWQQLKDREIQLIYALLAGGEGEGVVGRDAREKLKQFPSFTYWGALRRYRILAAPITRGQLIGSLDSFHAARRQALRTRDETDERSILRNWHTGLPAPDSDFLEHTTFTLTPEQAGYLTDRIQASAPGTYLAHLVTVGLTTDSDRPWADPSLPQADPAVRDTVMHAQRFSEVMHGAQLLYNLLVSEAIRRQRTDEGRVDVDEDLVDLYEQQLDDWSDSIEAARRELDRWDIAAFWRLVTATNPRIPPSTQRFVRTWIDRMLTRDPRDLLDDAAVRRGIRDREFETKGRLARLWDDRRLERYGGAAGASALNYRWGSVRSVVRDITEAREVPRARS
jgi:hypothetical protein